MTAMAYSLVPFGSTNNGSLTKKAKKKNGNEALLSMVDLLTKYGPPGFKQQTSLPTENLSLVQ